MGSVGMAQVHLQNVVRCILIDTSSGCLSSCSDREQRPGTRCRIENFPISFPEPAIPWEGNGGSGIIRDRHTKNCMSPVLRMRFNKPQ